MASLLARRPRCYSLSARPHLATSRCSRSTKRNRIPFAMVRSRSGRVLVITLTPAPACASTPRVISRRLSPTPVTRGPPPPEPIPVPETRYPHGRQWRSERPHRRHEAWVAKPEVEERSWTVEARVSEAVHGTPEAVRVASKAADRGESGVAASTAGHSWSRRKEEDGGNHRRHSSAIDAFHVFFPPTRCNSPRHSLRTRRYVILRPGGPVCFSDVLNGHRIRGPTRCTIRHISCGNAQSRSMRASGSSPAFAVSGYSWQRTCPVDPHSLLEARIETV